MKFKRGDKVKIKSTIKNFWRGHVLLKGTEGRVLDVNSKPAYAKTAYTVQFANFPATYFSENELK